MPTQTPSSVRNTISSTKQIKFNSSATQALRRDDALKPIKRLDPQPKIAVNLVRSVNIYG
jgi:hypothetical protein